MHEEDPQARAVAPLVSDPPPVHPRVLAGDLMPVRAITPATYSTRLRGTRTRARNGGAALALTVLYAAIAGLLGLLVDFLEHPPTVVTAIVVTTAFWVLVVPQKRPRS